MPAPPRARQFRDNQLDALQHPSDTETMLCFATFVFSRMACLLSQQMVDGMSMKAFTRA
jgi:hypothetical protein